MGTAILVRSDNSSSIVKSHRNPNHVSRKKKTPTGGRNPNRLRSSGDRNCTVMKHPGSNNLVMGQVKILKRGEKLNLNNITTKTDECYDLDLGSTDRLGPDPLTVKKQVCLHDFTQGLYAGPTSVLSPPPSFLPVPKFLYLAT
ncbi:hypothetical protein L195_g046327 [Trifolium pratense]|uniref:Uncharacterized protein n=2 Tax=Trifolium pratense TaxID=57577 RepID=A0ACB0JMP4_TRIPR|nr:uncharacterized protein LOC123886429 [Trifolium pratense]XP_045791701.1 uncharacterized protein LOC123886431 [Trifolium pratense]PNX90204.1 hypothetical protein L195_g046327 [Trifolium pratense]CAJ2645238.1 unnamed protein product [Trifolium pratense]